MTIVGRKKELIILDRLLQSHKSEFLAVYGRRRVGKTFLIHQFFKNKGTYFEITGSHGATKKEQLKNFSRALRNRFGDSYDFQEWGDALDALYQKIQQTDPSKKFIFFIDELPWLASPKSGFLPALDHLWNLYLSRMPNVLLVVCGSAAHWMIKKIIQNKGGLHNRLSEQIKLEPFTLEEAEMFIKAQNIDFDRKQLAELYMAFGGVAKYLSDLPQGKSASQIINEHCFQQQGRLFSEFNKLYESLFDDSHKHISVIQALAKKPRGGLKHSALLKAASMLPGGASTTVLEELEEAGFIMSQTAFGKRSKERIYRLVDEYSMFYLRWIAPIKENILRHFDPDYWNKQYATSTWNEWAGHAFENICLKHSFNIKKKLGISGITTMESHWQYLPSEKEDKGAEIDLVIDRADSCINLCEMKFSKDLFTIDKDYAQNLEKKRDVFREQTKTKKTLFTTLITTFGLKQNNYLSNFAEVTLNDLF
jgi:AAA+ ATPase superfamily predicted ATPase